MSTTPLFPRLPVLRDLLLLIEAPTSPFYGHSGGIRVAAVFVEGDDPAIPLRPDFDVAVLVQHLRRLREAAEKAGDSEVLRLTLRSMEAANELGQKLSVPGATWPPCDVLEVPPER